MRRPIAILALCLLLPVSLTAQQPLVWQQRADVGSPGSYEGAAMVFHAEQGVSMLFGGDKFAPGSGLGFPSNDLWQYDGASWQAVTASGPLPAARSGHALAYDPVDGRVLLFGGDAGGGTSLNDLWAFDFTGAATGAWTRLADLPSAGRRGAAMTYDAARGHFVVVGGIKQGTAEVTPAGGSTYGTVIPATRETWTWNRSAWTAGPDSALYNNGPILNHPDFKVHAGPLNGALGHHAASGETLLLAERALPLVGLPLAGHAHPGGTATYYDGSSWTANFGGHVPLRGSPERIAFSFSRIQCAYDPARQRLVVVPAGSTLSIEYNGNGWPGATDSADPEIVDLRGSFGPLPADRPRPCMAHDTLRGRTVYFGGRASVAEPGDTWELVENAAAPFSITTDLGTAPLEPCAGETISLTGTAAGVAPFKVRWFRDATLVAEGASFNLTLTGVTPAQSGAYRFEVTDPSGRKLISQSKPVFVHGPPVFTQQPQERRVIPGESFSLEAAVSSTLPVTYQWYRDADLLPGATSRIYTRTATPADAGNYSVFVTTRCTTVSSNGARVFTGPLINQQPVAPTGQDVMAAPVSLSVTGNGVGAQAGTYTTGGDPATYPDRHAPDSPTHPQPLSFTWRHEGVPLVAGPKYSFTNTALGSNLVIHQPDYEDEGLYDCVVTDAAGPAHAKTSVSTLLVLHPLAPPYLTVLQSRGPEPRTGSGMIYDSRRRRTVLFGGEAFGVNPRSTFTTPMHFTSNDTWEWDGQVWVKRNPVHRPPPTSSFGIAYDSLRGRTVIFGGHKDMPPDFAPGFEVINQDTWEWDGNDWTQVTPPSPPPARLNPAMCFDSTRGEILMLGGDRFNPEVQDPAGFNALRKTLWGWNGVQWTQRGSLPNGASAPIVGGRNAFGFDPGRGVAALFGLFDDTQYPVWEWNGSVWNRVLPPLTLRVQESRFSGSAFYDPVRRRIGLPVLSNYLSPGSNNVPAVVWWNGADFINGENGTIDEINNIVPFGIDAMPYGQVQDLGVFDPHRRCFVWHDTPQFVNQGPAHTREMHFSAKVKPVHQPLEVHFAVNQNVQIRSIHAGRRPLVHQWLKDGSPILDAVHFSGADTPTLTIHSATAADAGNYSVRVTNLFNQIVTPDIRVTLLNSGIGMVVQGGGLVLSWPGANGILETAASLTGPWTAVPGATPPYSVAMDEGAKFYRVRYP